MEGDKFIVNRFSFIVFCLTFANPNGWFLFHITRIHYRKIMIQRWLDQAKRGIPSLRHFIYHKDGMGLNMIFDQIYPTCPDCIHDKLGNTCYSKLSENIFTVGYNRMKADVFPCSNFLCRQPFRYQPYNFHF